MDSMVVVVRPNKSSYMKVSEVSPYGNMTEGQWSIIGGYRFNVCFDRKEMDEKKKYKKENAGGGGNGGHSFNVFYLVEKKKKSKK